MDDMDADHPISIALSKLAKLVMKLTSVEELDILQSYIPCTESDVVNSQTRRAFHVQPRIRGDGFLKLDASGAIHDAFTMRMKIPECMRQVRFSGQEFQEKFNGCGRRVDYISFRYDVCSGTWCFEDGAYPDSDRRWKCGRAHVFGREGTTTLYCEPCGKKIEHALRSSGFINELS